MRGKKRFFIESMALRAKSQSAVPEKVLRPQTLETYFFKQEC